MFQSTPSGGKATTTTGRVAAQSGVSIHAFRGEGDNSATGTPSTPSSFNPRLPGGRRPARRYGRCGKCKGFQSTPSGGKATWHRALGTLAQYVSIHAFRGEGDAASAVC